MRAEEAFSSGDSMNAMLYLGRATTNSRTALGAALSGLLAIAVIASASGCCMPCGGRGACRSGCVSEPSVPVCAPAPSPHYVSQDCESAEGCIAERAQRGSRHRLAGHLKPDGPMQPQVPAGPLPRFHPLPTKPVFEPGYFDTVVGPAEVDPSPVGSGLSPLPTPRVDSHRNRGSSEPFAAVQRAQ
jgi:hypothetical protein